MLTLLCSFLCSSALAGPIPPWELAGIYDASALAHGSDAANWLWQPAAGMTASCGAAKAPDGLGVMEAQAIANGMTPALIVLLRRTDDSAPPLDTRTVHMSLASERSTGLVPALLRRLADAPDTERGSSAQRLAPLVEHAPLAVTIYGDATKPDKVLVRTQLAMEMCLEHKTGRAWTGNVNQKLREAFLLQSPDERGADRMYFRGQTDPVPALLRPPDACLIEKENLLDGPDVASSGAREQGRAASGSGSLRLVPSDVWGASLRACDPSEIAPAENSPSLPSAGMPLTISGSGEAGDQRELPWRNLAVKIYNRPDAERQPWLRVDLDGDPIIPDVELFQGLEQTGGQEVRRGLRDILAAVPERYPTRGTAQNPDEFTVLILPNWQLVHAVNQLDKRAWDGGGGVSDGVGWVLAHPERLVVQVGSLSASGTAVLPNLTSKLAGGTGALFRWGYMVGSHAGRSDIVLTSRTVPTWQQIEVAQRTRQQGLFLGSMTILIVLLAAGLRRLPDLWTRVPEERIAYWPGKAQSEGPAPATPLGESELSG